MAENPLCPNSPRLGVGLSSDNGWRTKEPHSQNALHVLPNHTALALHYAARSRKLNPSLPPLTPISCPRCENICIHGRGSVRVFRRALVKKCNVCGTLTSVPRPVSQTKGSFPSVRARRRLNSSRKTPHPDVSGEEIKDADSPLTSAPLPPALDRQPVPAQPRRPPNTQPKTEASANKRQKSKGGLQGMLQRNREREMRETNKSANSASLTSFLQGL